VNPSEQNIAENAYISLTGREIAGIWFAFLVTPGIVRFVPFMRPTQFVV
jgi:hypothetical protein